MPEPKRHHYVPRFYLECFASRDNGILWIYDKGGGEPRAQTAMNTAVQKGFYCFDTPAGRDVEIEKALSRVESDAKPVLDRLAHTGERPTDQDVYILAQFLALTHTRVPRAVEMVKEITAKATRQFIRGESVDREGIRRYFHYREASGDRPSMTEDEFVKLLSEFDKHFDVEINREFALLESLSAFPKIADLLFQMNWCFCRVRGGEEFITSDTPLCVFLPGADGTAAFGAGFAARNTEISFPISPDALILLDWHRNQRTADASQNFVSEMNRRMAWSAERYVISRACSLATVSLVKEASRTRNLPKMDPLHLKQQIEKQWQGWKKLSKKD